MGWGWGWEAYFVWCGSRKSVLKGLSTYVREHFTNAAYGAYPVENGSRIAIAIVANKYSPNNFWYGLAGGVPRGVCLGN